MLTSNQKTDKLKSLFKKIDIFASPVELMIQKKRTHQSLFGAFMTLVMLACVLAYIANKFIQLSRRKEFQTLYSEVYYEEIPTFSLFKDNFTLQFAFQTEDQTNYIDETIYQVSATMVTSQKQNVNNTNRLVFHTKTIPLTKCSNIGFPFEDIQDQLDDVDLTNTYCINWEQIAELSLTGTPELDNYTYLYLSFQTCVNDTEIENSVVCKSKEEIQSKLHRNYIQFQISSYNIDLRNYLNPNVPKVEQVQTTISSQVLKDITIFMQPITTLTEEGLLDELVRKDSTIRYQKNQEIIDFNSDESLASVLIRLGNTENISYRIYPKLQDILAQAGGLWELLMLFFTIMVRPFEQLSYKIDIINSLFNFEGQKQEQQQEFESQKTYKFDSEKNCENVQTTENDASQMLNGGKIKASARFPRGRLKTSKPENSAQTAKSSCIISTSPENDKVIQKGIRAALRKLFNVATLKLRFNLLDFLKYLKCGKKEGKFKQLNYSIIKLDKCLDILFIIDKLQEIDKLKMILLNKQQVQLFDYLPKPTIYIDPHSQQQNETIYYSSLLKPHKTLKEKAQEAQLVLDDLLENLEDPITNKLIQLMDPNIMKLMQIQNTFKRKQTIIQGVNSPDFIK